MLTRDRQSEHTRPCGPASREDLVLIGEQEVTVLVIPQVRVRFAVFLVVCPLVADQGDA
jgi:hypothetical protein